MAFIQTVPVDQATGEVRALYERTQASLGYVPNYAKVFDALGALPDAAYPELEADLKRELTPGRPISPETPERIPEVPDRPPRPA